MASSKIAAICQDTSIIPLKVTLRILDLLANEGNSPDKQVNLDKDTPSLKGEVRGNEELHLETLDRNQKAVKADDAEVPEYLWDQLLVPSGNPEELGALGQLWRLALRWWKNKFGRVFWVGFSASTIG
jgi:hypothetical protein